MATILDELRAYIQLRMNVFDSSVSTEDGSEFDSVVITPLIQRFATDPLSIDIETFLKARITDFDPSLSVEEGSSNYDILIAPLIAILEPFRRELEFLKTSSSLKNYKSLNKEEMDSLISNFFTFRKEGAYASGSVRVYFSQPITITFLTTTRFYTSDTLNFYPIADTSFSTEIMSFQQVGTMYYADVLVRAENQGEEYNIDKGKITGVDGIPYAVKVSNERSFGNAGVTAETNEELYERARNAITSRTLNTKKGIATVLPEQFPYIREVEAIGMGDAEMKRDRLPWGSWSVTTITQSISGDLVTTLSEVTVTGQNLQTIGGKTDIYCLVDDVQEDFVDILNLTTSERLSYLKDEYGANRINLPLLRIIDVERLDPISLEPSGQFIPKSFPIDVRSYSKFYGGEEGYARGIVRLFFDRPTSITVTPNTRFTTDEGYVYHPVSTTSLSITGAEALPGQYITESEMDTNKVVTQDITYYYFDVTVVSVNYGSQLLNIDNNVFLTMINYTSEGWWLEEVDENYAYSAEEGLLIRFSDTFNDGILVAGEGARISYLHSQSIKECQIFCDSDEARVVTQDVLVKLFQPCFVDAYIEFTSVSWEEVDAKIFIEDFIRNIKAGEWFEISDLVSTLYEKGVIHILLPITVLAMQWNERREIQTVRFQDRYKTDRRCHFMPRNISIKRIIPED